MGGGREEAGDSVTRLAWILLVFVMAAAACGSERLVGAGSDFDPDERFDPTEVGDPPPTGYREALPRDAINPVYDPRLVAGGGVDWPDDELVIGVDLEGEARAYPVGYLTWHEIVNDNHRGIPTLVTW